MQNMHGLCTKTTFKNLAKLSKGYRLNNKELSAVDFPEYHYFLKLKALVFHAYVQDTVVVLLPCSFL
jgi:hypothetical protein